MLGAASMVLEDAAGNLPRLTAAGVLTDWSFEPVPVVVTVWAAGLYLLGVGALRRRGDRWPLGRTVSFVGLGLGSSWAATSSGLGTYDLTLLSVHRSSTWSWRRDLVGLAFFGVVFAQWVRASVKEAAREDRRLDLLEARAARGVAQPDARPADG